MTVRSDAEPQFHDTVLEPWWTAARFAVPAMTRDEIRQIIEKPAATAVLHFEPSRLVERLIDDVALVPAPLPLLSFALSELHRCCWKRWLGGAHDRGLREADYEEMGSVARALTQRATAVHDSLETEDPAYAITIRNVFTRMVAVVGGEVARRRVPRDELVYQDPAENQRVTDVLQRFHEARLISLGTEKTSDSGIGAYAEPTHDELVRGWTKVSQWLDEIDRTPGMRTLPALGDVVRSWQAHQKADSYLWNDPRVDLLSALGKERPFVFNAGERRFVDRVSDDGPMAVVVAPRDRTRASVEGEGDYVVILHDGLPHGAGIVMDSPRLQKLRATRTEQNQLRWVDPEPIVDDDHRDPVSGFEGRWLAGFAPVGDTGFVVIVQTRYEAAVGPNARLSRSFARRAGGILLAGLVLAGSILLIYRLLRRRKP